MGMNASTITVGDIRAAIGGLRDDAPVRLSVHHRDFTEQLLVTLGPIRGVAGGTERGHLLIEVEISEDDDEEEDDEEDEDGFDEEDDDDDDDGSDDEDDDF